LRRFVQHFTELGILFGSNMATFSSILHRRS
jgi:hypothetical protein